MFVAIHRNVPIQKDRIEDFKKFVTESNKELSKNDGFVARRLLEASDGSWTLMAEWQSKEQFEKVHKGDTHQKLHEQARSFMEKDPEGPRFYNVIAQ